MWERKRAARDFTTGTTRWGDTGNYRDAENPIPKKFTATFNDSEDSFEHLRLHFSQR